MSIYEKLYPWQQKIVDNFKRRNCFGLFLKMGLGKTPISLAFAEQNQCSKVMVITINPKAIEDENTSGSFLYWAKQSSIAYTLHNKNSSDVSAKTPEVLVVNYESLFSRKKGVHGTRLSDRIEQFISTCKTHNVAIIVDESHKTKNLQSKQTQAINQIRRRLFSCARETFTYLLTGTPFTTGYVDIYSQLKLLGYSENKTSFVDQFCVRGNLPGLLGWQQPIVGYKNVDQLFRLIHNYAITMESSYVANLPEQIFTYHTTRMSRDMIMFVQEKVKANEICETYERHGITPPLTLKELGEKKVNNPFFRDIGYNIEHSAISHIHSQMNWIAETSGTFWLRARQLSIGFQGNESTSCWFDRRRLDQLKNFLENNEDNYVLFYNYTPELLELYEICEELGYNIDVYCGQIKSLTFYERYSRMSESEKLVSTKNIILANFASGSTGMNWQEYHNCIIFSIPLYKDYEQGIARIHRLGQKHTTIYHIFYQTNWLDKSMIEALKTQQNYSSDMFEADLARIQNMLDKEDS